MLRFMALCRRCGNSYDVDMEPALTCHVGDDDWELFTVEIGSVIDDLVDAWHQGIFDDSVELEDVIRASTGWDRHQFHNWVRAGTPKDVPWPPEGLRPV